MASTDFTDGVTLTAATWFDEVDRATHNYLTSIAGTANAITATGSVTASLATGNVFTFIPASTNTAATTINITQSGGSALGVKNIFNGGSACVGGEIVANVPCQIQYDGTQFNLISVAVTRGTTSTTFTFDGTGGTTGAVTLTWQKIGSWVRLNIPASSATSGTSSTLMLSNTAFAAAARPAAAQVHQGAPIINNNAATADVGYVVINTNGTLQIYRSATGAAFTNGATAGTGSAFSIDFFVG